MKAATAYLRGEKIFLHSSSKTTAGVWVLSMPVVVVEKGNLGDIGRLILDSLNASQDNVPHPKSWTNIFDPVLQLAGIKSWNAFAKSAKCVEIESDGERIFVIPTKNKGADDGFDPIKEKIRSCAEKWPVCLNSKPRYIRGT